MPRIQSPVIPARVARLRLTEPPDDAAVAAGAAAVGALAADTAGVDAVDEAAVGADAPGVPPHASTSGAATPKMNADASTDRRETRPWDIAFSFQIQDHFPVRIRQFLTPERTIPSMK
jgi:hypothetical protein